MRYVFLPPPDLPAQRRSLVSLFKGLGLIATNRNSANWIVLDTPDHRLARAGLALVARQGAIDACPRDGLADGSVVAHMELDGADLPPRMVHEWPPHALRSLIQPLAHHRAILPRLTIERDSQEVEQRDDQGKVVVRCCGHIAQISDHQPLLWLQVDGLRGYEVAVQALIESVILRGWQPVEEDPLSALLFTSSSTAEKPLFSDGTQEAGPALRACLARCLTELEILEGGVIEDIDSEFIHQHRVLLRRLRSLVGQFAAVFDPAVAQRIRELLAGWARCSNALRDLDVWQLDRDKLALAVPADLRGALAPMFNRIAEERTAAHGAVSRQFRSAAHRRQREELANLIAGGAPGPLAHTPLATLAAERLWKSYRKIATMIKDLPVDAPADAVHRIRIRGKKLRYLLDACGIFLAAAELPSLVGELKSLQGLLGSYNDAAVQYQALRQRATATDLDGEALLAVGALLGAIHHRQHQVHERLSPVLAGFIVPAVRTRYRRLFRQEEA